MYVCMYVCVFVLPPWEYIPFVRDTQLSLCVSELSLQLCDSMLQFTELRLGLAEIRVACSPGGLGSTRFGLGDLRLQAVARLVELTLRRELVLCEIGLVLACLVCKLLLEAGFGLRVGALALLQTLLCLRQFDALLGSLDVALLHLLLEVVGTSRQLFDRRLVRLRRLRQLGTEGLDLGLKLGVTARAATGRRSLECTRRSATTTSRACRSTTTWSTATWSSRSAAARSTRTSRSATTRSTTTRSRRAAASRSDLR